MSQVVPRSLVEWFSLLGGLITILIVLLYCGWVIQSQERRWFEFDQYVRARDARWERHIERTETLLNLIVDRIGKIEPRP